MKDETAEAVAETWPGETEFVILLRSDWDKVADLVEELGRVTSSPATPGKPFPEMMLVPLVLDPGEE